MLFSKASSCLPSCELWNENQIGYAVHLITLIKQFRKEDKTVVVQSYVEHIRVLSGVHEHFLKTCV